MGSLGTRFGRYVPINNSYGETTNLYTPNPRTISQKLFKREIFKPATTVNLFLAAWIQFQVHDWCVSHCSLSTGMEINSTA